MTKTKKDRGARLLFLFGVIFLTFSYGLIAGMWNWWPAPQVRHLYDEARDLQRFWKNDYGLEPSRHLVTGYADRRTRFKVYQPNKMPGGYLIVAGLTPARKALNSAVMYDMAGNEQQVWSFDYTRFADDKIPVHVFVHGLQILPDGDAIFNFDAGSVLARMTACQKIKWDQRGHYHHAVSIDPNDGSLWTLRDSEFVHASSQTGEDIASIHIVDDIMKPHQLQALLAMHTLEDPDHIKWGPDSFHPNHIEALSAEMAAAFPQFNTGDLLISFRSINLLAVMDPQTYNFKWWHIGPWHRQHNPHFMPDGTIMVYDNNMNFDTSKIMTINPTTNEVKTIFAGHPQAPFYSWRRGKVQRLADDALLITESEKGRAFIVDNEGQLVWEYNNIYDETRNGVLNKAIWVPANYFSPHALDCN